MDEEGQQLAVTPGRLRLTCKQPAHLKKTSPFLLFFTYLLPVCAVSVGNVDNIHNIYVDRNQK